MIVLNKKSSLYNSGTTIQNFDLCWLNLLALVGRHKHVQLVLALEQHSLQFIVARTNLSQNNWIYFIL